jgi:hypothetical protein
MEKWWILIIIVAGMLTTFWMAFQRWINWQQQQSLIQQSIARKSALTPLKVSAFERLTILLERITPTSLILRYPVGQMTAAQLQFEITKSIREEYEHNIGLQLYVDATTWQSIVFAKDSTLELIKSAFQHVGAEATSLELSNVIFQLESETKNLVIQIALGKLKEEMDRL